MTDENTNLHLDEVSLSMIADGAGDALPATAHAHLATCDHCADRLADVALLAARVGEGLRRAPRKLRDEATPPVPVFAMLCAVVVAAFGALTSVDGEGVASGGRVLASTGRALVHRAPALLARAFEQSQPWALVAAIGLGLFGLALAFSQTRSTSSQEGDGR